MLVLWDSELARSLVVALAVTGAAFSVYLVVLQLFVIDATCTWCMLNDVVLAPLFLVLALARIVDERRDPGERLKPLTGISAASPPFSFQVIGTCRRMSVWMRSRISVRLSPVAVMPWLRSPMTAWAGSGSRSISSATASASSCVPHG